VKVTPIGFGAEFGYIIRGEISEEECRAAIEKYRSERGNDEMRSHEGLRYSPGFYRWIPPPRGDDFKSYIEDGKPGERGSFVGVYMEGEP
jgi:hypothetical protein